MSHFSCEALSASDYVQFSNQMIDTRSPRHCGQLKDLQVTSEKDFFRVTFKSNDRLDGTGFKASYIFLRDSEMHKITQSSAVGGGSGRRYIFKLIVFFSLMYNKQHCSYTLWCIFSILCVSLLVVGFNNNCTCVVLFHIGNSWIRLNLFWNIVWRKDKFK